MSTESSKQPTYMRYARVQQVLEGERAFANRIANRSEVVLKPNGTKQLFSPEVIAVTKAIHQTGRDAHKVHRKEIIQVAVKVFQIGNPQPLNGAVSGKPVETVAAPAALIIQTAPAPEATPAPVAKAAHTAAAIKPAAKPKAAPEAAAAPIAKTESSQPADKSVAPVEVDNSKGAIIEKAMEAVNYRPQEMNPAAYNAMISVYSLILSALQLSELFDKHPGWEKRRKTLDDLAVEVNQYTSIKSAKEIKKA